ncbi:TIGR03086 family protein [Actinomadura soli]|uniref:TIGR03086 family protein n=1 Tax=Actinomadura soli TaxID=2508997 RepID=A0A5C4J1X7_9ACTN|nr:TIGR03086 family metal-binding protein [Actinomadura soli]TMQ90735.1 TIGR03086 family protein [Actinomadura soli]
MNTEPNPGTADVVRLVERAFDATVAVLGAVPAEGWDAASPCAGWTVRQVGNHLVGSLSLVDRYAREEPVSAADADSARYADVDLLGDDPAKALRAVAERCAAAFSAFDTLDREVPFVIGQVPGFLLTRVCLLESLVHGWDIAHATGTPYRADDAVIGAVSSFARRGPIEERRAAGMFAPEQPARPDDTEFNRLLAFLGRRLP